MVGPAFTNSVTMVPLVKGDLRKKTLTFTWTVADDNIYQQARLREASDERGDDSN